jgi:hypothetical protein
MPITDIQPVLPEGASEPSVAIDAAAHARIAPAEHTPLPWEWWTSNSHERLTSKVTGHDGDVISAYIARDGHPCLNVRQINMEYIKHACNHYPRLVRVLKRIASIEDKLDGGDWDEIIEARAVANQALRELGEI